MLALDAAVVDTEPKKQDTAIANCPPRVHGNPQGPRARGTRDTRTHVNRSLDPDLKKAMSRNELNSRK